MISAWPCYCCCCKSAGLMLVCTLQTHSTATDEQLPACGPCLEQFQARFLGRIMGPNGMHGSQRRWTPTTNAEQQSTA